MQDGVWYMYWSSLALHVEKAEKHEKGIFKGNPVVYQILFVITFVIDRAYVGDVSFISVFKCGLNMSSSICGTLCCFMFFVFVLFF